MSRAPLAILAAFGLVALVGRRAGAAAPPPSGPPPGGGTPPTPPPGGGAPPTSQPPTMPANQHGSASSIVPVGMGARRFVESLPDMASPEREALILAAVRAGFVRPIMWSRVDCSRDGVEAYCWVSEDSLCLGTGAEWVRVNVSNITAQEVADHLGCLLTTSRIDDLAASQALVKLVPHNQTPDAHMADTSRMLAHHDAIERDRAGRDGLVRPVGKAYYLSNRLVPHLLCFGGWHSPWAGYRSPDGARVLQPVATSHEASYKDYSHNPTFAHHQCVVGGVVRELADVLRSPDAKFFSAEGPVPVRHPAVPAPAGPGVLV